VIRRESHCSRRELTPHIPLIVAHDPRVLLVGAGRDPGQAAPLGFDTLGVAIA